MHGSTRSCYPSQPPLPPRQYRASTQLDEAHLGHSDGPPLLEVSLELVPPMVAWNPPLAEPGSGVQLLLSTWLKGLLDVGTLIKRLDSGEGSCAVGLRGLGNGSGTIHSPCSRAQ